MILSKVAKKREFYFSKIVLPTSFAPFLYCFPIQNKSESIANSSVILQHCRFRFEKKKILYLKSKLLNKIIRKRKSGYYVYEFRIVYRKETLLDTKWFFLIRIQREGEGEETREILHLQHLHVCCCCDSVSFGGDGFVWTCTYIEKCNHFWWSLIFNSFFNFSTGVNSWSFQ